VLEAQNFETFAMPASRLNAFLSIIVAVFNVQVGQVLQDLTS
jgi:hypothetical protein